MDAYRYAKLDESRPSLRLLRVTGYDRDTDLISISLIPTAFTADAVENTYDAVSYVWGRTDLDKVILVDGAALRVRHNIWTFLRHYATTAFVIARPYVRDVKAEFLWIDAICINQSDLDEKNIQVAQMSEVYTLSRRTLVWLGQDSTDDLAWDTFLDVVNEPVRTEIEDLKGQYAPDEASIAILEYSHRQVSKFEQDPFAAVNYLRHDNVNPPRIAEQFWRIATNEYWSRLWIAPECILGQRKQLQIVVGTQLYDLPALDPLCQACVNLGTGSWKAALERQYGQMQMYEVANIPYSGMDAANILRKTADLLCERPVDHIFAIRPLLKTICKEQIAADYRLSPIALLFSVLRNFVQNGCDGRVKCEELLMYMVRSLYRSDRSISDQFRLEIDSKLLMGLPHTNLASICDTAGYKDSGIWTRIDFAGSPPTTIDLHNSPITLLRGDQSNGSCKYLMALNRKLRNAGEGAIDFTDEQMYFALLCPSESSIAISIYKPRAKTLRGRKRRVRVAADDPLHKPGDTPRSMTLQDTSLPVLQSIRSIPVHPAPPYLVDRMHDLEAAVFPYSTSFLADMDPTESDWVEGITFQLLPYPDSRHCGSRPVACRAQHQAESKHSLSTTGFF